MTLRLLLWLATAVALVAACGGGQTRGHPLDGSWDDEKGEELARFLASWKQPKPPRPPAVALGVVDATHIVGYAYDRGRRWEKEYPFESRPVLAGSVVVGVGEDWMVAIDALTGEEIWRRKAIGWLRGVGDDGETTVVSLEGASGKRSVMLAIDRGGNVVRQFYETATVGSPAVFDEFAFLPYGEGFVVVFDLVRGSEVARVVSDRPVSRAFIEDGVLYFGEDVAIRYDDEIVAARTGGGTTFTPPARRFPGDPRWLLPGDTTLPLYTTQSDAVRIYRQPGRPAVLSYHRLAIGLDEEDRIRWVHPSDEIYVGGDAGRHTVALCTASGVIEWLDLTSGVRVAQADVGAPLTSCQIQNDGPPGLRSAPPEPLEDQLRAALTRVDPLLLPMALVLLDELAEIAGDRATATLVQLARRRPQRFASEATVQERAAELLGRRETGFTAIVDALSAWSRRWQAYDLPVEALADAARRGGVTAAARPLARGLHHPYATGADLEAVARALARVATPRERRDLTVFYGRYRCATEPEALVRAVQHAARALREIDAEAVVDRAPACDERDTPASSPGDSASPPRDAGAGP